MTTHDIHRVLLKGFGRLGAPPLDGKVVYVGPLAPISFLMGRNNHGKSTLLRTVHEWAAGGGWKKGVGATPGDSYELVIVANGEDGAKLFEGFGRDPWNAVRRQLLTSNEIEAHGDEGVRFWVLVDHDSPSPVLRMEQGRMTGAPHILLEASGVRLDPNLLAVNIRSLMASAPPIHHVPAHRNISPELLQQLLALSNPKRAGRAVEAKQEDARWKALVGFVREVLEDPEAELQVEHGATTLNLALAQARELISFEQLGDGVRQVVIMAAEILQHSKSIITIEEPETHLHPGLQRKLVTFLRDHTDNQYLIATHSAHLAGIDGCAVFHVVHDGLHTAVTPAIDTDALVAVCADLGYRASDVLQSNFVLWVEGPSDRIYWRCWLRLVHSDIQEGVHFTIMTYGGRLRDGLTLDQEDAVEEDLIEILRLGQHCALITDSDKAKMDDPVDAAVVRLQEEARKHEERTLVIVPEWCRTIENLVPATVRERAAELVKPVAGRGWTAPEGDFDDPLAGLLISKTKLARAAESLLRRQDIDARLQPSLDDLARRIKEANGSATTAGPPV